jgi:DNA-directed RNA polymerase specialized sigma24 family protein
MLLEELPPLVRRAFGTHEALPMEIDEVVSTILCDLWAHGAQYARYVDNPAGRRHKVQQEVEAYLRSRHVSTIARLTRQRQYADALAMVPNIGADSEHDLDFRTLRSVVWAVLAIMPVQHRLAFTADEYEGLSYPEGAARLGLSKTTYATRLADARMAIRIAARDHAAGRPARPWPELKKLISKEMKGELT